MKWQNIILLCPEFFGSICTPNNFCTVLTTLFALKLKCRLSNFYCDVVLNQHL